MPRFSDSSERVNGGQMDERPFFAVPATASACSDEAKVWTKWFSGEGLKRKCRRRIGDYILTEDVSRKLDPVFDGRATEFPLIAPEPMAVINNNFDIGRRATGGIAIANCFICSKLRRTSSIIF
jgi:hypothetical protein